MKCPDCSYEDSKVVDSRSIHQGISIRRRRECTRPGCGYRYTTYEYILANPVKVIKKSGVREEYDREKLEKSFHIACKKRPVPEDNIQQAIHSIEEKISNISNVEIDASRIGELVMDELKKIDGVAFIRYASVYRQFKDVGEFKAQIEDLKK
ncbi:MAG: transcriptional regulator NrdR [Candidatus Marinimicrobia bacterium]|jgi:transcriptional repressor NrdR|nr:transcriptional regulator NrdR [Candidatus Neomarinimicrobiota bacterium]